MDGQHSVLIVSVYSDQGTFIPNVLTELPHFTNRRLRYKSKSNISRSRDLDEYLSHELGITSKDLIIYYEKQLQTLCIEPKPRFQILVRSVYPTETATIQMKRGTRQWKLN